MDPQHLCYFCSNINTIPCNLQGLFSEIDNLCTVNRTELQLMSMWHHDMMSHADGCLQKWKKTSHRNSVFADTSNLWLTVDKLHFVLSTNVHLWLTLRSHLIPYSSKISFDIFPRTTTIILRMCRGMEPPLGRDIKSGHHVLLWNILSKLIYRTQ